MARGRSIPAFERVYIDGYDMSGYTIDAGERGVEFTEGTAYCMSDAIKGSLLGQGIVSFGPLNGVFDNTSTSGIHVLANAAQGVRRNVMHVRGVQAVPAIGDDVFCWPLYQSSYKMTQGDDTVTVNLAFAPDSTASLNYKQPFGALLHAWGNETAANTANTNADGGAESTRGGWLMYQIYSITGSGTVTISVDDSANGTSWLALSGATSGAIATASAPIAGFIQLSTTATVRRYLRWQMALGGSATACTFILAFMRG